MFVKGITAAAADSDKFGQAGDVDAPRLVIGEMEVEVIEAIAGHHVEDALHLSGSLVVARDVDHQTAVFKVGSVIDDGRRHSLACKALDEGAAAVHRELHHLGRRDDAGGVAAHYYIICVAVALGRLGDNDRLGRGSAACQSDFFE